MLHVTNGDSAAQCLRLSGLPGDVLPWRDVLHEGPVPADLAPDQLREVRARFLADQRWTTYDAALADFVARDATLAAFGDHDEVVLWFEHDLYDQLQLLQILDFFAGRDLGPTRLSLICIGAHPEVVPFHGLGELTPQQLGALFPARLSVSQTQLALASTAWAAFRAPEPTALQDVLVSDTSSLAYLHAALERLLEEYPSTADGLSRTERQIVETLDAGQRTPVELFGLCMEREEAPFMGDLPFFAHVAALASGAHPLVAPVTSDGEIDPQSPIFRDQPVMLTDNARALLANQDDWVHLNALAGEGINRWFGGVHVQGADAVWRWDRATRRLVSPRG